MEETKEPYEVDIADVAWWAEITPREYFTDAYNQARRIMNCKHPKEEQFKKFKKEYRMFWNWDNTFTINKR